MYRLNQILMDEEFDDLPTGEGEGGESEASSPFLGDLSEQDVLERLGLVNDLPGQVRGVEERLTGALTPLQQQLQELQAARAQQPAFSPKLDAVNAVLKEYDPTLAEKLGPALAQALQDSFSYSPLDGDALRPHIEPMLGELRSQFETEHAITVLDSLGFDPDSVVNREDVNQPATDLQKDFLKWYGALDVPTRRALAPGEGEDKGPISPLAYARAMQKFAKWRGKQIQDKGEEAGNAARRLAGASSISSQSRSEPRRGPRTEADGFYSVFKEAG
jgi:hypothetical protein